MDPLPLPGFYRAENASSWDYAPDLQRLSEQGAEWRARHRLSPARADRFRVHLLLVDLQKDFCFPEGSLYVGGRSGRGALEDSARIAEFIYRNLPWLTWITTTMDTHHAFQIFSPSFWLDAEGRPVSPHREVTLADLDARRVRPDPALAGWFANGDEAWLERQVRHYCAELQRVGKYTLYLWPPHCILGGEGHTLAGVIHEARMFYAYSRLSPAEVELKGGNPLTENYSVLRPEVLTRHDGGALDQKNERLIEKLLSADAVIVAGQAASHCVKSTLEDLLDEVQARDPALARRVYILADCMSSVAVPDQKGGFLADFTEQTEAAMRRFAAAGMHLVRSTDPLPSWPGMKLGA